jgi:hypothetical protein
MTGIPLALEKSFYSVRVPSKCVVLKKQLGIIPSWNILEKSLDPVLSHLPARRRLPSMVDPEYGERDLLAYCPLTHGVGPMRQ